MMPINTQKQQELFEEFIIKEKKKNRLFDVFNLKKPVFPQHRLALSFSYEVVIIILIGVVLAASVLFSLGVERGRILELGEHMAKIPLKKPMIPPADSSAAEETVLETVAEVKKPAVIKPESDGKQETKTNMAGKGPFTVQIASYKTRDMAEKELNRLKQKGYSSGDIIKKGNYFILCVGSYATKDDAQKAVTVWERQYKGCIIRKR